MKLTIKVKLLTNEEQKTSLVKTMEAFNKACNDISQVAWENKKFGQVGLHHLCYRHIRDTYGLSAQLTVRAIGKVSESYRANKDSLHLFRNDSAIVYDERILSFKGIDRVSILTLDGRIVLPFLVGAYAKLDQRMVKGQCDLILKKGVFYLCVCVEVPDGTPFDPKGFLGVDMGIVNLATDSDGESFSGEAVEKARQKRTSHKQRLQKKGTKSAKTRLKKVSGKEAGFKRNTNHTIAKKLVRKAKDTSRGIALEDLSGIRGSITVRKAQRDQFGKWSFDQLRQFLTYKAILAGVTVLLVDPRNTSRQCSHCGHIDKKNRKTQSEFVCLHCQFSLNADFNAAINIASRASVNTPIAV